MDRYIRITRDSLNWVTDWIGTDGDSELRSEQAERVNKEEKNNKISYLKSSLEDWSLLLELGCLFHMKEGKNCVC